MSGIISTAMAATAAANTPPPPGGLNFIVMMGGFFLICYFMLWRPQSKRAKEHRALLTNLKVGDEVITNGGLLGSISKVGENFIVLTVGSGLEIKVQKTAVSACMPKGSLASAS